ncbi:MAG: hypothetical protein RI925_1813, partial [Pseudomonadota bacterium]
MRIQCFYHQSAGIGQADRRL